MLYFLPLLVLIGLQIFIVIMKISRKRIGSDFVITKKLKQIISILFFTAIIISFTPNFLWGIIAMICSMVGFYIGYKATTFKNKKRQVKFEGFGIVTGIIIITAVMLMNPTFIYTGGESIGFLQLLLLADSAGIIGLLLGLWLFRGISKNKMKKFNDSLANLLIYLSFLIGLIAITILFLITGTYFFYLLTVAVSIILSFWFWSILNSKEIEKVKLYFISFICLELSLVFSMYIFAVIGTVFLIMARRYYNDVKIKSPKFWVRFIFTLKSNEVKKIRKK
ncbi:MAG: hypothetical protein JJV93_00690 [Alphaproteobacteria bacterium]|nr:hypothetical protein [Alphaproteobacteria bacterium]MBL0717770.1 hypothetical protein [Alphaproteobacteria bacterium]